jgi:hypothetical protein
MKKDSKINDLLEEARRQGAFDKYYEWDIPKKYRFPVFKEQIGSVIFVYKLKEHTIKNEKKDVQLEKIVNETLNKTNNINRGE